MTGCALAWLVSLAALAALVVLADDYKRFTKGEIDTSKPWDETGTE